MDRTHAMRWAIAGIVLGCLLVITFISHDAFHSKTYLIAKVGRDGEMPVPSDGMIQQKVEFVKQHLKTGQTKEEVVRLLGSSYQIAHDNGDSENGSEDFWKYRFFLQPGYQSALSADHVIDEEGLLSRRSGADLVIGWRQDKLHIYTITYPQGDSLYMYILHPNGTTETELLK